MKWIRYEKTDGSIHYGASIDGQIVEAEGDPFTGGRAGTALVDPAQVARLLAPVEPKALFCIGLNYRKHAEETGAEIPKYPVLFMKNLAAVQHPEGFIELPRHLRSDKVDYEVELAAVVGRRARNVPVEEALSYLAGYTCGNDVSARDWQKHAGGGQWCRGKSFDTFCPIGPCLADAAEIPDPQSLGLRTRVNGEILQESSTADMIFSVAEIISFLSGSTTLLPGTVILTGTPEGVGMARTPFRWLQSGDVVEVEIDGIGTLRNPVREES
jgi:2-keto-4-pentenoate hydratase/2-oxohepta-3-ene-1,7-dioic acid hydratase in catechol pathway